MRYIFHKQIYILLFIFFLAGGFLLFAHMTNAEPVLLEPSVAGDADPENLGGYFESLYEFVVGLAAALAVVMLTIGGVQYMASRDNPQALGEAKSRIWSALGGLILVLLSWIILNTINPELLNFNVLGSSSGGGSQNGGGAGGGGGGGGGDEDEEGCTPVTLGAVCPGDGPGNGDPDEIAEELEEAGITISSSDDCSDKNNSNCTSFEGMQRSTVDEILAIQEDCGNCGITVTGGTEIGHTVSQFSHGNGYKFDVDKGGNATLDAFMSDTYGRQSGDSGFISGSTQNNEPFYEFEDGSNQIRVIDEGNHWDVQVIPLSELQGSADSTFTLVYSYN